MTARPRADLGEELPASHSDWNLAAWQALAATMVHQERRRHTQLPEGVVAPAIACPARDHATRLNDAGAHLNELEIRRNALRRDRSVLRAIAHLAARIRFPAIRKPTRVRS